MSRNSAAGEGGGVRMEVSLPTFMGNSFEQNSAGDGGGLYLWMSTATMEGNTFLANSAGRGGGLHLRECDGTLTNNIFADNQATQTGSGLYLAGSLPRLVHTTLAGNSWRRRQRHLCDELGIFCLHPCPDQYHPGQPHHGHLGRVLARAHRWRLRCGGTGLTGRATARKSNTGTVNLWGSAAFVDPLAGGHYHIGPDSVAVDAGVNGGVTLDIDGDPRPLGAGFELGADEVLSAGWAGTWATSGCATRIGETAGTS